MYIRERNDSYALDRGGGGDDDSWLASPTRSRADYYGLDLDSPGPAVDGPQYAEVGPAALATTAGYDLPGSYPIPGAPTGGSTAMGSSTGGDAPRPTVGELTMPPGSPEPDGGGSPPAAAPVPKLELEHAGANAGPGASAAVAPSQATVVVPGLGPGAGEPDQLHVDPEIAAAAPQPVHGVSGGARTQLSISSDPGSAASPTATADEPPSRCAAPAEGAPLAVDSESDSVAQLTELPPPEQPQQPGTARQLGGDGGTELAEMSPARDRTGDALEPTPTPAGEGPGSSVRLAVSEL